MLPLRVADRGVCGRVCERRVCWWHAGRRWPVRRRRSGRRRRRRARARAGGGALEPEEAVERERERHVEQ